MNRKNHKWVVSFFIGCFCILLNRNFHAAELRTYGFYRGVVSRYRSTLFNPDGFVVDFLKYRNSEIQFSQLLDIRIRMLALDWQLDAMEEVEYRDEWKSRTEIKQLYFQKDIFQNGLLVFGRSIQQWGTGYAFNPTDVVAPDKTLSDPENAERRAVGNDMVKLEFFWEHASLAMCYLTRIHIGSIVRKESSRLALRYYQNMWNFDISLIAHFHQEQTPLWGLNFSTVLGDRLEIHGEFSVQSGNYRRLHRVIEDGVLIYASDPVIQLRRNDGRLYTKSLFGFQVTLPGNILWVSEYFHQDHGYSRDEWGRILDQGRFLNQSLDTDLRMMAEINLLWSLNVFSPGGAMRDYLMNHLEVTLWRILDLRGTALVNLNDGSCIVIPEIQGHLNDHLTLYSRCHVFFGREGSEFREMFQSMSAEGGMRVRL